jgi:hypothetical protein
MLYRVIEKKQRREVARLELDGKEDEFNFRMVFPADQFVMVPIVFQVCEHEMGMVA